MLRIVNFHIESFNRWNIQHGICTSILRDFITEQQRATSMPNYTNITCLLNYFISMEKHHVWTKSRFGHILSILDFQMCAKREQTRPCSKRRVCNMDFGYSLCWKLANWILLQDDTLAEVKPMYGYWTISLLLTTLILNKNSAIHNGRLHCFNNFTATNFSLIVQN